MPLSAFQLPVSSRPTVDFLEDLPTNVASATVDLSLPLRDAFWFVRAITIVSVQNLAWELMLFSTAANNLGGSLAAQSFIGVWQFGPLVVGPPASPGWPIAPVDESPAPDAWYRYYVDGNMMPYFDGDQLAASQASGYPNNAKLHCRLINRSAGSKLASAAGALKVTFWMATQGAQV